MSPRLKNFITSSRVKNPSQSSAPRDSGQLDALLAYFRPTSQDDRNRNSYAGSATSGRTLGHNCRHLAYRLSKTHIAPAGNRVKYFDDFLPRLPPFTKRNPAFRATLEKIDTKRSNRIEKSNDYHQPKKFSETKNELVKPFS